MEAQVDILDGKRRALAPPPGRDRRDRGRGRRPRRHDRGRATRRRPRRAGRSLAEIAETLPPTLSRVVLNAQEDLRREIARSMHDGPAQSLTNITLQAQIVERLLDRDPAQAQGELRLLVQMVQQTLEATKGFIFDVRPMVLDDLGLVPTLRRAARDRGRRAHVPVEFDSHGHRPAAAAGHREHGLPGPRRGAGVVPRARAREGVAAARLADELEAQPQRRAVRRAARRPRGGAARDPDGRRPGRRSGR